MAIGAILTKIIGGNASGIVDSVGGAIDKIVTSKEEKERLKIEMEVAINNHVEAMMEAQNKELELYLKDMQSARDANVRIQESDKASWWAKNTAYFLDVFVGLIWGSVTVFLIAKALHLVDNVNANLSDVLAIYSTITALFVTCLNFHRGSSKGSADKQKQLDKLLDK